MNTWYHARSSVAKWGGKPDDYLPIHDFIDSSKSSMPDIRHRAIFHHSFGIFVVEKVFGSAIENSNGRMVPVREIAERHVIEDLGFIPTVQDWLKNLSHKAVPWAGGHVSLLVRKGVKVRSEITEKCNKTRNQVNTSNTSKSTKPST